MKNKPSSEKEQVAHQVTAAADALMEVLQPRGGEHKASLCKWACRVRANEIYQSWCWNCGRQGVLFGSRGTEICVRRSVSPSKWFRQKKKKVKNKTQYLETSSCHGRLCCLWWLFMRWTACELMKCCTHCTTDWLSERAPLCCVVSSEIFRNKAHHTYLAAS